MPRSDPLRVPAALLLPIPAVDDQSVFPPLPNQTISAVGCDNGFTVLAGTDQGNIYAFDVPSKRVFAKGNFPGDKILQFSFMSNGTAVARLASKLVLFDGSRLIGQTIATNGLPIKDEGGQLNCMAVDNTTAPDTIYVATDFGIHASWDVGANWLPVSQGLPVRAHPSTLRFVLNPLGITCFTSSPMAVPRGAHGLFQELSTTRKGNHFAGTNRLHILRTVCLPILLSSNLGRQFIGQVVQLAAAAYRHQDTDGTFLDLFVLKLKQVIYLYKLNDVE